MARYPLHDLNATEFEQLVALICQEILGIGVTSFAAGRDGGKDAKFEGTANTFPSKAEPATGKFIVQAKFTSHPNKSCSEYEFATGIINKEIPKIRQQFNEGRLTHYLIFTNRRKTGGAEDQITERIKGETGVQYVWLLGLEDIERILCVHQHLVKAVGLDRLRSPLQFTPEDLRDVIVGLHDHRQVIHSVFDSEHDFRDYPGLPRKNVINGLTVEYDAYIRSDSMLLFPSIECFLKNPRNEAIKEQYHAVADELKGQLILHRERFDSFDGAMEHIFNLAHERIPELKPAPHRRLIKVMIHYMYVNCEIGQKE